MLYVNDDNIDDLFRRAAEDCPLKTDNADFDAVLRKMKLQAGNDAGEAVIEPAPAIATRRKRRGYAGLMVFLLLLSPLVILELEHRPGASSGLAIGPSVTWHEAGGIENDPAAISAEEPVSPDESSSPSINRPVFNTALTGVLSKPRNSTAESDEAVQVTRQADILPGANVSANDQSPTDQVTNPGFVNGSSTPLKTDTGSSASINSTRLMSTSGEDSKVTDPKGVTPGKKVPLELNNPRRFYIGIIFGPDFSAIHLQSVKKTGYGYGGIIGYQANKHLSVETGLLRDRKYYATDGEYFSTKGLTDPQYAKIEYVQGYCNMWEIPLNIRYQVSGARGAEWLVSAGTSSYFMSSESYVYDLNYNGYRYPKSYNYTKNSTNFFAVANLSAGYTRRIGSIGDLRIEPYIKLPVSRIGTGSLRVQSGGINLALTRKIF